MAGFAAASPAWAHAPLPGDVPPDLDQLAPADLVTKRVREGGKVRFHLGFTSATVNRGRGALTMHGHRETIYAPTMQVDQLLDQRDGGVRVHPDVGLMQYAVHPDHDHWHLLGFARYELRRPGRTRPSIRFDRKTGFCLGDRFRAPGAKRLAGFDPVPQQGDTCGLGKPDLMGLFAGISVGYGDAYAAYLEGQYIDVTDAPARRYVLVHSANADGRLVESDEANNAASVLIDLTWPRGRAAAPRVEVLKTCPNSSDCTITKEGS